MSETLLGTSQAFFGALSSFDTERLTELLHEDYVHTFAPSSEDFSPALTRDEFVKRFETIRPVLQGLKLSIIRHWINEGGTTVTAYAEASPVFRDTIKKEDEDEEQEWIFRGEYMFVFEMDEEGRTIVKTLEFVEGKVAERMRTQIAKAFGRLQVAASQ